jgi:hypothetical protein
MAPLQRLQVDFEREAKVAVQRWSVVLEAEE